MGKKKQNRASRGLCCLGVLGSSEKCQRARDGSGLPVVMNKKCVHCGEQRCRLHCKCGRSQNQHAKGRAAPRGTSKQPKVRVVVSASSSSASVATAGQLPGPSGRAPGASCLLLDVDAYYIQCCNDIATASEVELASYQYDSPALQKVVLRRLAGRSPFSLRVYLDAEKFAEGCPYFQRSRVRELFNAGAKVLLCKGPKAQGAFHCKGIVVDRKYLYSGSANATYKSLSNEEFCFRITGPSVSQVLQRLSTHLSKGRVWDGS